MECLLYFKEDYCVMITIGCCIQQRLFVKRKIKVIVTMKKQSSKNCININFYTYDLLHLMRTTYRIPDFLRACGARTSTIVLVS